MFRKIFVLFVVLTMFFIFSGFKLKDLLKKTDTEKKEQYEVKESTKAVGVRGLDESEAVTSASVEEKKNKNILGGLFKKATPAQDKYEVKDATKATGVRGLDDNNHQSANTQYNSANGVPYMQINKQEIEGFKNSGGLK